MIIEIQTRNKKSWTVELKTENELKGLRQNIVSSKRNGDFLEVQPIDYPKRKEVLLPILLNPNEINSISVDRSIIFVETAVKDNSNLNAVPEQLTEEEIKQMQRDANPNVEIYERARNHANKMNEKLIIKAD